MLYFVIFRFRKLSAAVMSGWRGKLEYVVRGRVTRLMNCIWHYCHACVWGFGSQLLPGIAQIGAIVIAFKLSRNGINPFG